jgi:hypothetical protein
VSKPKRNPPVAEPMASNVTCRYRMESGGATLVPRPIADWKSNGVLSSSRTGRLPCGRAGMVRSLGSAPLVDILAGDVLSLGEDGSVCRTRVGTIAAALRPRHRPEAL